MSQPSLVELAIQHHRAGRLLEAESLYRKILDAKPSNPGVLHLLGLVQYQSGKLAEALQLVRKAIKLNQREAAFHASLGKILKSAGETAKAEKSLRDALRLDPNHAETQFHLASLLLETGHVQQALPYLERALSAHPDWAPGRMQLIMALAHLSRFDDAIRHALDLLQRHPDHAMAHYTLADIYAARREFSAAIQHYDQALALGVKSAELYQKLGNAYQGLGGYTEAAAAYQHGAGFAPERGAGINLGLLGNVKISQGLYQAGIAAYETVIRDYPEMAAMAHSAILLALHYFPQPDPDAIYRRSLEWHARYAAALAPQPLAHPNSAEPGRRIRVGYVSADFRQHAVGYFLRSVMSSHGNEVEVFLYSNLERSGDALSDWFKSLALGWRDIGGLSDDAVADLVRSDKIDILVDLSGHTAGNRLLVFARKPAPIQVSWLGYCDTTGLAAMDYLLADDNVIPPQSPQQFSERVYRLPGGYLCYQAPEYAPEAAPPPVLATGQITFGCCNNLSKVNEATVDMWCTLLKQLPTARLVLKTKQLRDAPTRERYLGYFTQRGVGAERVDLSGEFLEHKEQYAFYGKIDIALDTFPYNGVTTTCDALWMGVPVITLAGEQFVSRNSADILTQMNLPELIAATPEQYVAIALELASNLQRLAELRRGMRARFSSSPLGKPGEFTRHLENAFRSMWQAWCLGR